MKQDDEFVCRAITGCAPSDSDGLITWLNKTLRAAGQKVQFSPRWEEGLNKRRVIAWLRWYDFNKYDTETPEQLTTILNIRLRWLKAEKKQKAIQKREEELKNVRRF